MSGIGGKGFPDDDSSIGDDLLNLDDVNSPPVAQPATNAVLEDHSISGNVVATDAETAAADLVYALTGAAPTGLTFNADGSYTFDASDYDYLTEGQTEDVTVTYQVTDEAGATDTNTLTITITGTNDGPVAQPATNAVLEDHFISGNVVATDAETAAADLVYALTGTAPTGLTFNADGSYTFDASDYDYLTEGQTEDVTVTYQVTDEAGATDTNTLTITVTGTNDGPVAQPGTNAVLEDHSISGNVVATDAETAAADLVYALTGAAPTGLTFNADGSYTFDASDYDYLTEGQTEDVTVTYQVTDEAGATDTNTLTITVTGTNDGPVAQPATNAVLEDHSISGNVVATDAETAAADLVYALTGAAPTGLTFNADGSYTFDASDYDYLTEGQTEDVTVTYQVTDEAGATDTNTLTITVTGTNDGPVAQPATNAVLEDHSISGNVVATDAETAAADLVYALTGAAPTGLTFNADGSYTFDASDYDYLTEGQTEDVTVTYQVTDEAGATDTNTLTITITGTNDGPVAQPATNAVLEDHSISGNVVATDAETAAADLVYALTGTAPTGLTFNADGSYTFDASDYDYLTEGQTEDVTVTYQVTDEDGATDTNTLTITVTGTNDGPVAQPATNAVLEDHSISGNVVATDAETAAADLVYALTGAAPTGLTFNADGSYTFDASDYDYLTEGQTEDVTVTYQVTDEDGATDTNTLTITVTGTNDGPVAQPATNAVLEDHSISGNVVATDAETAAADLVYALTGAAPTGLTFNADGSYTFDASDYDYLTEGQTEDVTVTYQVTDEDGATDTNTLTITVTGTNDGPVAQPATNAVLEDHSISGNVVATDAETAAADLVYALTGAAPTGLTFNADGSYTFDASDYDYLIEGQTEDVTVTYQVTDEDGATDTNTLTITVTGTNDGPVAQPATNAVLEDHSISGNVVATDAETAAADLVYALTGAAPTGLTFNADGSYTFDASDYDYLTEGQTEDVTVTYQVTDEAGATDTNTLTITVTGTNDGPVAQPATNAVLEDHSISGNVVATDAETAAADLVYALTGTAPTGLIFNADGSYTFDASDYDYLTEGQTEDVTVTYQVTDEEGATDTNTLTITVTGTNDGPVAQPATNAVLEDHSISGNVVATDAETAAADLVYALTGAAPTGLTFNADGSYTFDASDYDYLTEGQTEDVTVTYQVTDEDGATDTNTLTITVTGTNDGPVAQPATNAVLEDHSISGNVVATDAETAAADLVYALTGAAPTGLTFNADGSYTFDASDYDYLTEGQTEDVTVTYQVTDEDGATDTNTLTITVTGTNDGPVAQPATNAVLEDHSISGNVVATDAETAAADLVYALTGAAPTGLTFNADGSYTFDASDYDYLTGGQTEDVTVTYQVTDEDGATDTNTLTITVTGTNDGPVAQPATNAVLEDHFISGNVVATDAETAAADLVYALTGTAPTGLTFNADGSYTFDASDYDYLTEGQTEDVTVTYQVTDEAGTTDTNTLTITVTGTNDGPVAVDDANTISEDATDPATGNVLANDTDADAVNLTVTDVDGTEVQGSAQIQGDHGTLTIHADGSYSYDVDSDSDAVQQLDDNEFLSDSFSYTVSDGQGGTDTASLEITIEGHDDTRVIIGENGDDIDPISGGSADDILSGDFGGSEAGTNTTPLDYNYVVMMDTSGSMNDYGRLSDLKSAMISMIDSLQNEVNAKGNTVTLRLMTFDNNVDGQQTFTLTQGGSNWAAKVFINNMSAGGGTNYEDALLDAKTWIMNSAPDADKTHALFISDGKPTFYNQGESNTVAGPGYKVDNSTLENLFGKKNTGWWSERDSVNDVQELHDVVDSMRTVAIGMNEWQSLDSAHVNVDGVRIDTQGELMDALDSTGDAIMLQNSSQLNQTLSAIVEDTLDLVDAGSDVVDGNAGSDVIFGDSMDTSALALAHGINLPEGSGWEVFEKLESDHGWTREETVEYIRTHHEELGGEVLDLDGHGREGGHDLIHGGEGNDIIYGQEGNDTIYGDSGVDLLNGGSGDDVLFGGAGNDTFVVGDGVDSVHTGEGADTIYIAPSALGEGMDSGAQYMIGEDVIKLHEDLNLQQINYNQSTDIAELIASDSHGNEIVVNLHGVERVDLSAFESHLNDPNPADDIIQYVIDSGSGGGHP
ncbi:VCBS domain-containing protein [Salidesulfovibrio onnuriiensis]|uniref:VCBS domain-containing protein n=1 Tax=Salidesulfovibrio onnuriiensis TaxID=2583823 RepID=UPI0016507295|nr:VCBS domain-containing protein [Salidesulfovibrio onnuriiensis]